MKTCSRCKELKPATLEVFGKQTAAKDGLQPWCRSCMKEYIAKYRKTPAGKATKAKADVKYKKSDKGKATDVKYKKSDKGKATKQRYRTKIPPGVYQIKNLKNNKVYIGESKTPNKRKTDHWASLKGNYHENPPLQQDYNKYGEDAFVFEMLEYCERSQLKQREAYWIKEHIHCCYNNCSYTISLKNNGETNE